MKHAWNFKKLEDPPLGEPAVFYKCMRCGKEMNAIVTYPNTLIEFMTADDCKPICEDFAHLWEYNGLKSFANKPDCIALICIRCGRMINIEIHKLIQKGYANYIDD